MEPVEPGDEAEQRGLAAARRAGDGHRLTRGDVEVHTIENRDLAPAAPQPHHEVAHLEDHPTHTTLGS